MEFTRVISISYGNAFVCVCVERCFMPRFGDGEKVDVVFRTGVVLFTVSKIIIILYKTRHERFYVVVATTFIRKKKRNVYILRRIHCTKAAVRVSAANVKLHRRSVLEFSTGDFRFGSKNPKTTTTDLKSGPRGATSGYH